MSSVMFSSVLIWMITFVYHEKQECRDFFCDSDFAAQNRLELKVREADTIAIFTLITCIGD